MEASGQDSDLETTSLAPKRLRSDEPPGQIDDENTSCYSLDMSDEKDTRPFTVVHYGKERPAGIPVIFKPSSPGLSFWNVNPNAIANDIIAVTKEKILSHKINKDGSLLVSVASLDSANKLLALNSLGQVDVSASVPKTYSRNLGKIKNVPLEYTNIALLDYFKESGVTSAQRQVAYVRQEDGSMEARQSRSVVLMFRTDRPMPQRVFLGFTSHPVEEYFGPPVQCFQCQRYGHVARYCRGPLRCKVCAGPHRHKDCTSKREPKCANCGDHHPASFSGCPRKKAASVALRSTLMNGRNLRRRAPSPNPAIVRRPAPPQASRETSSQVTYAAAAKRPPKARTATVDTPRQISKPQPTSETPLRPSGAPSPASAPLTKGRIRPSTNYRPSIAPSPFVGASQSPSHQQKDFNQVLLPMFFAALRAILQTSPEASNLPEVRAFFAMEHLVVQPNVL